jgi:hypothetical protein
MCAGVTTFFGVYNSARPEIKCYYVYECSLNTIAIPKLVCIHNYHVEILLGGELTVPKPVNSCLQKPQEALNLSVTEERC